VNIYNPNDPDAWSPEAYRLRSRLARRRRLAESHALRRKKDEEKGPARLDGAFLVTHGEPGAARAGNEASQNNPAALPGR